MIERLFALQDPAYREFQRRLMPTVDPKTVIGVRITQLRKLAKTVGKEDLGELPHPYYELNNLHAFYIEGIRDFDRCIEELEEFLPYVDNWATCDSLRPKCFKRCKAQLLERIKSWLQAEHPYTVRFAIEMLMLHYLEEDFSEEYPKLASEVCSNEYYVNMMIAWYFATALAKQYDAVIGYLEMNALSVWIHNKTVQKAIESDRIPEEQKIYLRTLRRKT